MQNISKFHGLEKKSIKTNDFTFSLESYINFTFFQIDPLLSFCIFSVAYINFEGVYLIWIVLRHSIATILQLVSRLKKSSMKS